MEVVEEGYPRVEEVEGSLREVEEARSYLVVVVVVDSSHWVVVEVPPGHLMRP